MLTDETLITLINEGLTDEEIINHIHINTKPSDLYGVVAELVTKVLHRDIETFNLIKNGSSKEVNKFNKVIESFLTSEEVEEAVNWWSSLGIDRLDTKFIVMTFLYGSSEYGNRSLISERIDKRAEEQVEKGLDAYWDRSGADIWKKQRVLAITVMVRLVRGAMSVVCPSTVETMTWLQKIAKMLGARDIPMKWKTYLGFEVTQENPNLQTKIVQCLEEGKRVASLKIKLPSTKGKKLNASKMAAGAAPNFVHSADACHIQLVALATDTESLHMIHDSMATQLADTPELAYQIRETFCELYEDTDVLFDIWLYNKGEEMFLPEPKSMGALDVGKVRESKYFFH